MFARNERSFLLPIAILPKKSASECTSEIFTFSWISHNFPCFHGNATGSDDDGGGGGDDGDVDER